MATTTSVTTQGPGQFVGSSLARSEYVPGAPIVSTSVTSTRHTRVVLRFPNGDLGHIDCGWDIPLLAHEPATLVYAEMVEGPKTGQIVWLGVREAARLSSYYFWPDKWLTTKKTQEQFISGWLYALGFQRPRDFVNVQHRDLRLFDARRPDGTTSKRTVEAEAGRAAVVAMAALFFPGA